MLMLFYGLQCQWIPNSNGSGPGKSSSASWNFSYRIRNGNVRARISDKQISSSRQGSLVYSSQEYYTASGTQVSAIRTDLCTVAASISSNYFISTCQDMNSPDETNCTVQSQSVHEAYCTVRPTEARCVLQRRRRNPRIKAGFIRSSKRFESTAPLVDT